MIFIGICGASGSGKSTLADSLAAALGSHAMVIFRLSDNEKGIRVLQDGDIELLTQEEVRSL